MDLLPQKDRLPNIILLGAMITVPTKTQLSNFLGTRGEDYFKGNPKSLNFYFLVIWWGKINFGGVWLGFKCQGTLSETNSQFTPENRPNLPQKEKGSYIPTIHAFRDENVSFREGKCLFQLFGIFTYIWLIFYGKCREIYYTWMRWG